MNLVDSFGRRVSYLRLSVTDRCNFRCCYCMPATGVPKRAHDDVLSFEDLYRIAREAVALGVEKVRVTGGEPLVRRGVVEFLARLSGIEGLNELTLTTNGSLLSSAAEQLRRAGVTRINISLDSLRSDKFAQISRGGDLEKVLNGIHASEQAGLGPLKINMVVMRGVNDDEILDFADLTFDKAYSVRFIEYMPTGPQTDWRERYVPGQEILDAISSRYSMTAVEHTPASPARNYRLQGAVGTIGVITPVSQHFCDECNRIRVTATGNAKACLFAPGGMDLKTSLRRGDAELRAALRQLVRQKPFRHAALETAAATNAFAMAQIGG